MFDERRSAMTIPVPQWVIRKNPELFFSFIIIVSTALDRSLSIIKKLFDKMVTGQTWTSDFRQKNHPFFVN